MFLSGTLLNVATVLAGTAVGLLVGSRMPERLRESLVTGLGFFTLLLAISMGLRVFTDPAALPGDDLAILAAVLTGVAIGELLRLHDGLEALGAWFQRRLARGERPSRIAEGFVTTSLVFCVGPLTILGSLDDGLGRGIDKLALKATLDGFASIAFAASLGWGVAASALAVLVVQGSLTALGSLLGDLLPDAHLAAITATGGLLLVGVALRLLRIRPVPVGDLLPALLVAPVVVQVIVATR